MSDNFSELSDLSRKLNEASDRINSTISATNSKLNRLNLGFEVWLTNQPVSSNDTEEICLGYCEVEGEWQLTLRRRTCDPNWDGPMEDAPDEAIDEDYRPLLKAGRGLRLDALALMPRLAEEIRRRGEFLLREIDEAEKSARQI